MVYTAFFIMIYPFRWSGLSEHGHTPAQLELEGRKKNRKTVRNLWEPYLLSPCAMSSILCDDY